MIYLLVGLGNVGLEYAKTRHNFGFMLIDQFVKNNSLNLHAKKFKSEIFQTKIDEKQIIAIKPQTFMNNSGMAVYEVANFFKISSKQIFVFHDEIDLPLGKVKIKFAGSSAGHNGINSIDQEIGKDYFRIRLGVGKPENKEIEISDYVLGKFKPEELTEVTKINQTIINHIPKILDKNFTL
jgi:PTH1 family peptidyl-tRNA hydrolase